MMKKGQYYPTSYGHRTLCSQKPFMKLIKKYNKFTTYGKYTS